MSYPSHINYKRSNRNNAALRLFYNGFDYVVAESKELAATHIAIYFGEDTPEVQRGDDLSRWSEVPAHEEIPLLTAEGFRVGIRTPMATTTVRTAGFWVDAYGEGYLASSHE